MSKVFDIVSQLQHRPNVFAICLKCRTLPRLRCCCQIPVYVRSEQLSRLSGFPNFLTQDSFQATCLLPECILFLSRFCIDLANRSIGQPVYIWVIYHNYVRLSVVRHLMFHVFYNCVFLIIFVGESCLK